jgi:hypothetical protein
MDVSLGGARLATPWALPVGVNLELSLTLEGLPGEFLHWARVQWVREDVAGRRFQIGLQFTDATPGTRAMWRTYLEKVVAALEP